MFAFLIMIVFFAKRILGKEENIVTAYNEVFNSGPDQVVSRSLCDRDASKR